MAAIATTTPSADIAMMAARQAASTGGLHGKADLAQIRKSATDFEAVFASEMLSHMFQGLGTDPMFGGGHGEDVFRSLLVDQYGHAIAKSGTLGIADRVTAELIKAQEH